MTEYWERHARIQGVVDAIPEGEELDWLHALERRFGWAGTMFTPDDITARWEDLRRDDEDYKPLTEEQLENIMNSYYWSRAIQDRLTEEGWVIVDMAIDDAIDGKG